ncbi:uncharacterized protein [Aristolochia californica]|uniref:uncharacterized protein n=1 Tax=Aristolochia californica TaxID=171875 RepID=UPI0035D65422
MRIRKFANLAASTAGSASPPVVSALQAEVETHVCELNRSPWDVMTFAPQSHLKEGEDEVDEERDEKSVENERESPRKKLSEVKEEKIECRDKEKILCRKSGSKGWKCGKEAKEGHSLCEHHLTLKRCYRYESCRKPDATAEEYRRIRGKRSSNGSVSDFYYYSGFGPRWRRRRGSDVDDNPATGPAAAVPTSPTLVDSNADDDDDGLDEGADDAHKQVAVDVDNGHDDYEDDDDDDVDDADYKNKARKPRKARSLKSLF